MKETVSLKLNYEFRRLYDRGKRAGTPNMTVYFRRNGKEINRLGITVSKKLGNAVCRNRVRRRLREVYRTNEQSFQKGCDIVIVARQKSVCSPYSELESDLLRTAKRLGICTDTL